MGRSISIRKVAHLVSRFCEKLEIFGSSLLSSGLASVWSLRDGVASDHEEKLGNQSLLFTGLSCAGANDVSPVPYSIQTTFEADPAQINVEAVSGSLHQPPNEIVSNQMDLKLSTNHFRTLALQDIKIEDRFDLSEVKFDRPALTIKGSDVFCWINLGIDQGRVG